jgi:hypothetical protein
MNPFSALESDDEDDFVKVQSNKKNGEWRSETCSAMQPLPHSLIHTHTPIGHSYNPTSH